MEVNLLNGLSLMKDKLINLRKTAVKKQNEEKEFSYQNQQQLENDNSNQSFSKNLIGNDKSYIKGNYSPSPSKINQNSFMTNVKLLNQLESPKKKNKNYNILQEKQQNYGIQQIQQLRENYLNQNLNLQNNQKNYSNKQNQFRASDQMEQSWLRQTIDQLCEDNQQIYQNSEDSMKVIQKLKEKIQNHDNVRKQLKFQQEFSKQIYEKYQRQLKENQRLREKMCKCRGQFFNLKQTIIKGLEEEWFQNEEDKKMIDSLIEENQKLRDLVKINFSDQQILKFEKLIENEEGEFFSQYCNQEEKMGEIEIKYLSKKNLPNKNFQNSKELNKKGKSNQYRGDLNSLLGNQFSRQIKKDIEENAQLVVGYMGENKQDILYIKNKDLEDSDEGKTKQIQEAQKQKEEIKAIQIINNNEIQDNDKKNEKNENKVSPVKILKSTDEEQETANSSSTKFNESNDEELLNTGQFLFHQSKEKKLQNSPKDISQNLQNKDFNIEQQQQQLQTNKGQMDQNEVDQFLKQMNYQGSNLDNSKGYLADFLSNNVHNNNDDDDTENNKKQFFENENNFMGETGRTIEYEEYNVEEYYEEEQLSEQQIQNIREQEKKQEILKMKQSQMELQQSFLNFEEKIKKRNVPNNK